MKRSLNEWLKNEDYLLIKLLKRDGKLFACVDNVSSDFRSITTVAVPKDVFISCAEYKNFYRSDRR